MLRLFVVFLLLVVELAIALPVMPALAMALGGDAVHIGLLYALQSFGQFAMSPFWGGLSDRLGRKRVLLLTIFLVSLAELATAFAPTLLVLYAVRLLVGLCAGGVAAGSALVSDITTTEQRSRGMAMIGIAFGLGFTIGPGLGAGLGYLAHDGAGPLGAGLPFIVAAVIGLLNVALGAVILVEPRLSSDSRHSNRRARPTLSDVRALLHDRITHAMLSLNFLYTLAASVLESTFFVFMAHRYGHDERQVGMILAGMGLLLALTQGGVGRVATRLGERKMSMIGGGLVAFGLIVGPMFQSLGLLLAFLGISTIGRAFIHPGILALTSRTPAAETDAGRVMGALQSAASLGRIIGPAAGGALFAWLSPEAPFIASGVLMAVALVWWKSRLGEWQLRR